MDLDAKIFQWKVSKELDMNKEDSIRTITELLKEKIFEKEKNTEKEKITAKINGLESLCEILQNKKEISFNDLTEWRKTCKDTFGLRVILKWLVQIASAIDHMHNFNGEIIIHRDIKPKNIFISVDGTIKLGDFGTSKICDENYLKFSDSENVGTTAYQAPELFNVEENTTKSVDIWFKKETLIKTL